MSVVVGVTGASGIIYAASLLRALRHAKVEAHLVVSEQAEAANAVESGGDFSAFGFPTWRNDDFTAPFVSGSHRFDAVVVVPCSMATLARVASGVADTVIGRTVDVALKERRRTILVVRETPLNLVHIRNMETVTMAGAIVLPASPSFYSKPQTIEDLVNTVTARVLDHLGIEHDLVRRWGAGGPRAPRQHFQGRRH